MDHDLSEIEEPPVSVLRAFDRQRAVSRGFHALANPLADRAHLDVGAPCADEFAMPFWDETSKETLEKGVPWAFTVETVEIGGKTVRNPLRSYTFPRGVCEPKSYQDLDSWSYSKPKGYETVRYPFSGIVHPKEAKAVAGTSVPGRPVHTLHCPLTAILPVADAHNAKLQNMNTDDMLNQNVIAWMTDGFREKDLKNVARPSTSWTTRPILRTHTLPAPVADGRHWRRCHVPQVPPSA